MFTGKDLTLYDIFNLTSYDKTLPTLRKRLASLENKGLIIKYNRTLYGKTYYRPNPSLYIENSDLITLIEKNDLNYGDYYTAALLNYFRQRLLNGETQVSISHNELKQLLRIDKSRLSVRTRIQELLKRKIIKGRLTGRIYNYEFNEALLNNRSPEVINELSDKLSDYFCRHLNRFGLDIPKCSKLSFQRMLVDGYEYGAIKHIIAYLGYKRHALLNKVTQVSHIKKYYERLYEDAFLSLSKRKAHTYLYKLCSGFYDKPQIIAEDKESVEILEELPELLINKQLPCNEELWAGTIKWCESRKYLIKGFYNRHKGFGTILEEEDVYNSILYKVFEHMKKNPQNTISLSSNYLEKCVKSLLIGNYVQSYIDFSDDTVVDNQELPLVEEHSLDEEIRSEGIKNQLQATGISAEILNIVFDSLALNGVRYTQRDLAKKHNKSLSKINRLLTKYIPLIKRQLENLAPPN